MNKTSIYPRDLEEAEAVTVQQPALFTNILYEVGLIDSRFFLELRDQGKLMGLRCPECQCVYVPPRVTCKKCFRELNEWIEVGDQGTLMTYTIVYKPGIRQPMEPPYVLGIIMLDGADTGLVHCLGEINPDEVSIGMRVKAVLKESREGNIRDIRYFRPI